MAEFRTEPHGWPVSTGGIVEASNGDDRVRVFLDAPWGGPRVDVGVASGYEWDADEFTDPAELRALAGELLQAADILEAVQVGSYRPPSRTTVPVTRPRRRRSSTPLGAMMGMEMEKFTEAIRDQLSSDSLLFGALSSVDERR